MRARRLSFVLLLAGAAVLAMAAPSRAQLVSERIVSYGVDLTIQQDGSLLVVERIEYDFGSTEHHGIFRDIPARFTYDDTHDRVYPIDVQSVEGSPGTPAGFKVDRSGSLFRIQIGDANKTITGRHTYTITYRVQGALNGFADHDELYWNAVGPGWTVPVGPISVKVTAPAAIGDRVTCFSGPVRSSLTCAGHKVSGSTATFRQPSLDPDEALTIVVGFPTGVVPTPHSILVERFSLNRAFARTPASLSLTALAALFSLGGLGWLLWTRGRDRRAVGSQMDIAFARSQDGAQRVPLFEEGTYPVEYVPPDDIKPGQVGALVDEQVNPVDVTASIVDLAVRGYLVIEEIPKHGLFGKPNWRLTQLKDPTDDLLEYERLLLVGLFEDSDPDAQGRPSVLLSDLKKKFSARLKKVQDALYNDVLTRKWFAGRPDKVRDTWHTRGWALAIIGGVLLWFLVSKTHLALVALPIVLGGLLMAATSKWMPRRTPKGTGMVRRVLGFRTYIETAEAAESRFQERENIFSKYLPYAIVFGCTDKWARAFAHLGDEATTATWYVGPHPFTYLAFADSIDHFSMSSAGTISSTPSASGSSGFGGGGFSGGGGGGGGGGSW
jgi:uncharacterized membrane protein YgcG